MIWCIESVNERASLAPEPAQEAGGSPQPAAAGACTKDKGECGAVASHTEQEGPAGGGTNLEVFLHLCPALL